jgi:hypothetical protein
VKYAAMPTEMDFNKRIADSQGFANRYPVLTSRVRAGLPALRDANEPNPYLSSQIVFQPLWHYRTHYSKEAYTRLLLRFLARAPKFTSYTDFASQLVSYLKPIDADFAKYLTTEFTARGLGITAQQTTQ